MIRAIFFDFDGVLVDTERLHRRCWAEVLRPWGIDLSWDLYSAEMIGVSHYEMVKRLCRRAGRRYSQRFFASRYAEKKLRYEQRALRQCRTPRALVCYMIRNSKKYKLGVVSSSSRSEVEPILKGQGIRECLTALVCDEDVTELKPAPEPYLRALEVVNGDGERRIGPAECLVVEDSGPGETAARRAGMQVVRVSGPGEVLGKLKRKLGGGHNVG